MLDGLKYDSGVDWWSFGCLLYELVSGYTPFRTPEAKKDYSSGADGANKATLEMEPAYPSFMSAPLQDLLQHLLEKDPAKRLRGMLQSTRSS